MKKRGRYERQVPKSGMKKGPKIALIVAAVFVVLIAAAAIAVNSYINSTLNKLTQVEVPKVQYTQSTTPSAPAQETLPPETTLPEETTAAPTEPHIASSEDYINILVVGQAGREGEIERRADSAILVTINTYEKTLTMTSLLRDTLVSGGIRYEGKDIGNIKINTVYHLGSYYKNGTPEEKIAGSMYLMNQFLYKDYGIEVDYNIELDFNAFVKAIDMLGGIRVELTEEEARYLNNDDVWVHEEVTPGENRLFGLTALSYVRMRKADGDGESDIKRTERQRKFITLVIEKLGRKSLPEIQAIADEILPMIATSMTTEEIKSLMVQLLPMLPDLEIVSGGTCPAYGTYKGEMKVIYKETGVKESVLTIYDWEKNKKIMRHITKGEPHPDDPVPTEPTGSTTPTTAAATG